MRIEGLPTIFRFLFNPRWATALLLAILSAPPLPAQVVIPLRIFHETGQLGISLRLGDSQTEFTYILDTGSAGFFTAMGSTPAWEGTVAPGSATGATFDVAYGTGSLRYRGEVVLARLTFTDVDGKPVVVDNAQVGLIKNEPYPGWNEAINNPLGPIAPERPSTHYFFGTLGAGLYRTAAEGGGMTSVLTQFPLGPGVTPGFVIQTGGRSSDRGRLTVGLTPEIIASFPIRVPMVPSIGVFTNPNGTRATLYPEVPLRAQISVTTERGEYSREANVIPDTGGLGIHITRGAEIDPPRSVMGVKGRWLREGGAFSVRMDGVEGARPFEWRIDPLGGRLFDNRVAVERGRMGDDGRFSNPGSLNTGIALYYDFDVLFDTQNGIIGFRPLR